MYDEDGEQPTGFLPTRGSLVTLVTAISGEVDTEVKMDGVTKDWEVRNGHSKGRHPVKKKSGCERES